ncbi:hypothetical protein [Micromonospora sp. MH33]|uniref:hypothetical protein n=1 Tax=Micromonospora sp. MH33 TaxID=1945509 RepID=UPI00143D77CC|nr:hypothetical protein [Micromonospora sp. MH33]
MAERICRFEDDLHGVGAADVEVVGGEGFEDGAGGVAGCGEHDSRGASIWRMEMSHQ